jgi:hypothetical protein
MTWSEPLRLVRDAPSPDVGLPQTLEPEPGRFVTFYHSQDAARQAAELFALFWRLRA